MKLSVKIFIGYMLVFSVAFLLSGSLFVRYSYERAIEQETRYAFNQFQYVKYVLYSSIYGRDEDQAERVKALESAVDSLDSVLALYDGDKKLLYSNLTVENTNWIRGESIYSPENENMIVYRIMQQEKTGRVLILTEGTLANPIWLVTESDITATVENQRQLIRYFEQIYLVILAVSFIVTLVLTRTLLRPVARVSAAAKRIGEGNYKERITVKSRDEIGELAENFNRLAETVEARIEDLTTAARQREDFVANFAHELKTPLTSMIGYADILYRGGLSPEMSREAAESILTEGMRLETLSAKLMEMFMLNRQEFVLESVETEPLFADILRGVRHLSEKRGVTLKADIDSGNLRVEYDLFKSMLTNLIDNAAKAGGDTVWLIGKQDGGRYTIDVRDNGRGIPEGEIGRITEAFYMVDKSRSRRQHSVGLGLTLAERIAKIHGGTLAISSDGTSWTNIRLDLPCDEGKERDHGEKE